MTPAAPAPDRPGGPATLPELIAHRALVDADLDAVVTERGRVTYGELDRASASIAARLMNETALAPGDRVGLLAANSVEWAVAAFAIVRIGAVLVPLSTLLRPPELRVQLDVGGVRMLIAADAFRDRRYFDDLDAAAPGLLRAVGAGRRHATLPSLEHVVRLDDLVAGPTTPDGERANVAAAGAGVRPDDDLTVLFTSGSSGAPKGVIHTHAAALWATRSGLGARGVRAGERLYVPMPMFWVGGLGGGLLTTLTAGATLITETDPAPAQTLDMLRRERVTLFRGWPDQGERIAAHAASHGVDLPPLGDASLPMLLPAERRPAPGARPNLFGMTETFGPYSMDPLDADLPAAKHGSCGRPLSGMDVRVVDPDTATDADRGQRGEIWVRGPNLLRGIAGRATETVFTADGYYRTGDAGRLDTDGYLWHLGRLDDMIKVSGATVYPHEVESALRAVDGVASAHVTNVAGDDGADRVGALVVVAADTDIGTDQQQRIERDVRRRLSSFKVPKIWLLTGDPLVVPVLASNKVDKPGLRLLLGERAASAG